MSERTDSFPKYPHITLVRQLLMAAFNDAEFTVLCSDYFWDVYNQFTATMTFSQKIQLLLDHCQRKGLIEQLLRQVNTFNPYQYSRFSEKLAQSISMDEMKDDAQDAQEKSALRVDTGGGDIAMDRAKIVKSDRGVIISGEQVTVQNDINIKNE